MKNLKPALKAVVGLAALYLLWALVSWLVAGSSGGEPPAITPTAMARTTTQMTTEDVAEKRSSDRRAYRKAHRLYQQGHPRRAKRVLRRARIKRHPVRGERIGPRCPTKIASSKRCYKAEELAASSRRGHSVVRGRWRVYSKIGGFTLAHVTFHQHFRWRKHRVRHVGPLRVRTSTTGWSDVISFNAEGVEARDRSSGRYCTRRRCWRHGYVRDYAENILRQCLPVLVGCVRTVTQHHHIVTLKIGDGHWQYRQWMDN
jgi:hypothetical protein